MRLSPAVWAVCLLVASSIASPVLAQSECYDDVVVTHTNIEFVDGTYQYSRMINGRPSFIRSYQTTPTCGVSGQIAYSTAGYWFLQVSGSPACSPCEGDGYAFYRAMCGNDSATPPTECGWFRTPGYQQPCWEGQYYADIDGGALCVPTDYPAISMAKDAAYGTYDVGDEITYTFTVTNTGTMPLTDIVATDQTLEMTIPLQQATLNPGEATTGILVYTVLQSDIVDGQFTNTARVLGIAPDLTEVSDSAQETVTVLEAPAISLEKEASTGPFDVGDSVEFTFDITNTGSVTLYNVALHDDTLGQSVPLTTTTLEPGESTSGTLQYTITQDDIDAGNVTNEASVQASTASGTAVADTSSASVQFTRSPSMNLSKSAEAGVFYEGDAATFSFTLVNTGNVTLHDLSLIDHALGETVGFSVSTLTPGSSTSASLGYTVTAADAAAGLFSNFASAEAWTLYGERVDSDDQASIICAVAEEKIELPRDVVIQVAVEDAVVAPNVSYAGDAGIRVLSATICQGEPVRMNVSVCRADGTPINSIPVYGTLLDVTVLPSGETADNVSTVREVTVDGTCVLGFDTVTLAAGLVDVRVWIPDSEAQWRRIALVACGENVDNDLVSDSVDACPTVSGIASNAGCPRGDLDHSGIPDDLECLGETLIEDAYPVRLVVETTSNWTSISLAQGNLLFTDVECEGKPMWACTGTLDMILSKPCCAPNTVSGAFDAFVFGLTSTDLEWTIEKGGLGLTSLEIYSFPAPEDSDEQFELLRRIEHTTSRDADSTVPARTFSQSPEELTGVIDPVDLDVSCQRTHVDPLVLALYSMEYGTAQGPRGEYVGWKQGRPNYGAVNALLDGPYDSMDGETIRRHIDLARQAGIDALVCQWTGTDSEQDQALKLLLDTAEDAGLWIALQIDGRSYNAHVALGRFFDTYVDHPALLRVDDKPVLFLPHNQRGPDGWASELDLLREAGHDLFSIQSGIHLIQPEKHDGVTLDTFVPARGEVVNISVIEDSLSRSAVLGKLRGDVVVAAVYPGGVGAYWNGDSFEVARNSGATYELLWSAAISSNVDWVLIRSFNLWLEGTEIEPSEEYGSRYLDLTRQFAEAWKAGR